MILLYILVMKYFWVIYFVKDNSAIRSSTYTCTCTDACDFCRSRSIWVALFKYDFHINQYQSGHGQTDWTSPNFVGQKFVLWICDGNQTLYNTVRTFRIMWHQSTGLKNLNCVEWKCWIRLARVEATFWDFFHSI